MINNASAAASLISATTNQIADGLFLAGCFLGEIPAVGPYLEAGAFAVSGFVRDNSDGFNVLSTIESFVGTVLGDQQMVDSNKLTADSGTLATDQSNAAQASGQLQADLNMQTVLADEYDATLQAFQQFAGLLFHRMPPKNSGPRQFRAQECVLGNRQLGEQRQFLVDSRNTGTYSICGAVE